MAEGSYCQDGCDYCTDRTCDTVCSDSRYCQTCESFCEHQQISNNGFTFSACVAKNEIIGNVVYYKNGVRTKGFSRDTWNEAIERINAIYGEGDHSNAAASQISLNNTDEFMTFDEYKRVADAIDFDYDSNIQKNAIIYGQYFKDLENAVAKMLYKSNQCDTCNATCNVCETCQSCNKECDTYDCDHCNYRCDVCDTGCCEPTTTTNS